MAVTDSRSTIDVTPIGIGTAGVGDGKTRDETDCCSETEFFHCDFP